MKAKLFIIAIVAAVAVMIWIGFSMLNSNESVFDRKSSVVSIYFGNDKFDAGAGDCQTVFSVQRPFQSSGLGIERDALNLLLLGPNASELNSGYWSSIPDKTYVGKFDLKGSTINIDLLASSSEPLSYCAKRRINSAISETIEQFGTVRSVNISLNGQDISS